ncbi:hypothetical protein GGR57DRAFT_497592 [Xylariaceae sp. FL1272]|nr:hypothetical protein GGR57DRAFT_497592 [Xylariaceae sp. FL1272]
MSVPVERMGQLSLESMSTSSASQPRRREEYYVSSASDSDAESGADDDSGFDYDKTLDVATFPSGKRYSLRELDINTREAVVRSINTSSKLSLRRCHARDKDTYFFLVAESREYHVRMAADPQSPWFSPSCSCRQENEDSVGHVPQHPCRHTLWVCDQVAGQMLAHQSDPYTLRLDGYTNEEENLCQYIDDYGFEILAKGLNCELQSDIPSSRKLSTARDILATLSGASTDQNTDDVQNQTQVIVEGDLEQTVFRMLVHNNSFYSYVLSAMRHFKHLNARFRLFREHVDATLAKFDGIVKQPSQNSFTEFILCVKRFRHIEQQILSFLLYSDPDRELDEADQIAAVYTLVYCLERTLQYNEDHFLSVGGLPVTVNLCDTLINQDKNNYVLDVISKFGNDIVRHSLTDLIRVEEQLRDAKFPRTYHEKFRDILRNARVEDSRSVSEATEGSKKRVSRYERDADAKRVR